MRYAPPLVLAALLALTGCSTMEGLKDDLARGYDSVTGTFARAIDPVKEEKKKLPVYDGTCPQASVRPDLAHLSEFTDDTKPSDATMISELEITAIDNTCRTENGTIVMQIDLNLAGKTGPKGRMKPGDKPSFAYPYFVAVTDAQGNVLSKEIFAASVAYGKDQTEVRQSESIFQNMPFPDSSSGQSYSVIVGFQLSPEQLAYNQSHPRIAAAPASPATSKAADAANN